MPLTMSIRKRKVYKDNNILYQFSSFLNSLIKYDGYRVVGSQWREIHASIIYMAAPTFI